MRRLKYVLIVGNGINEIDASGEDVLSLLVGRLRGAGYEFGMSGLNDGILDLLKRTHLYEKIGEENLFRNVSEALKAIHASAHEGSPESACPLLTVVRRRSECP
jgi:MFS superfamily sulfate permease-like transporter